MKLKHHITGTILAIVFAATSALPAATIPQLKSPPKAPAAPKVAAAPKVPVVKVPVAPKVPVVPKVVATPKVPVVPKVVSAPKIPVVKVPAVKVPAAPKIPTVKVPAPVVVKVPAVKTPITPKVPAITSAPKIPAVAKAPAPAKAPTTPKTPVVAAQALTSKAAPKIISNNNAGNVAASSAIRQAVRGAQQDNVQTAPDAGVKTGLPGLPARDVTIGGRSSGGKPGTSTGDRATSTQLFDVLTGKEGATTTSGLFGDLLPKRDAPALTEVSQSGRAFDQGFASSPDVSGFKGDFGNPMSGIANGGSIGGILGAAAEQSGNGNPYGGLAGMGTGLISDGGAASSGGQATYSEDEGVKGRSDNKGLFQLLKERFGVSEKQANEAVKTTVGIGNNRNGSEFLNDPNGDPAPATQPAEAPPAADPLKTQTSSDGRNTVVTDPDGTKNVYVDGKKVGTIAPDGTATPTEGVSQPDPENEGATKVDIVAQSPALQQQIRQARSGKKGSQGGSADSTPVEDGIGGVANGVVITQQSAVAAKNNMLGNPGQNGGLREGGSGTNTPVRSNGSGVITPTNDQNMSGGGRQEDPGEFFGNGVSPDTSRLNNNTSNGGSSDNNEDNSSSSKDTKKKK